MKLVVDGNDGTGKSTLVGMLRQLGYEVSDRGIPTKMTDDNSITASDEEFYFILDVPVEVSQARLLKAGRDLKERYHTLEDLVFYRERFLAISKRLENSVVIDASGSPEEVLSHFLSVMEQKLKVSQCL